MDRSQKEEILDLYCNSIDDCDNCELMKKYDKDTSEFTDQYACIFDEMSDDMLDKCYAWFRDIKPAACENAEGDCCNKESNVDMVNHHKNIIEEMRRLFDLFDSNVEIFINKSNKTIDISIQM